MIERLPLILLRALTIALLPGLALANSYPAPAADDRLFGGLGATTTARNETLLDVALAQGQGYRELKIANPDVDVLLPGEGTEVRIPSLYLLPDELAAQRAGIVINVAEFRLYHRRKDADGQWVVETFPISIGRQEWQTPAGNRTTIIAKAKDPTWYPPETVRQEHEEWGDPLPRVVPPGDDNPLGKFALRLGLPGYLIHGTNRPYGIGMRVTHGCVRMYPKDIEALFYSAPVGVNVNIVNRPYKIGRYGEDLYLEVHPVLEGEEDKTLDLSGIVDLVALGTDGLAVELDWEAMKGTLARKDGVPTLIGTARAPVPETPADSPAANQDVADAAAQAP